MKDNGNTLSFDDTMISMIRRLVNGKSTKRRMIKTCHSNFYVYPESPTLVVGNSAEAQNGFFWQNGFIFGFICS